MKLLSILTLICICVSHHVRGEQECPSEHDMEDFVNECSRHNSSPEKAKCVMPCLFEKLGVMARNGKPDMAKLEQLIENCNSDSGSLDDDTKAMIECWRENVPKVTTSSGDCSGYDPIYDCIPKEKK